MAGRGAGRATLGILIALGMVSRAAPALAVDVHTRFDSHCRRLTGVLAHVDATHVSLVDLDGNLVRQRRDQIDTLVVHGLIESPLGRIRVDAALAAYLRHLWIGADQRPTFTGFATGFHDDLVIFIDLDGKTHVLEARDVRRMGRVAPLGMRVAPGTRRPPELAFPPEVVPCGRAAAASDVVPPTYVIADRIKLGDHLTKLEEHYRALDGFEERTKVYASPFVVDQASRVGLVYFQGMALPVPFYFRWMGGRAYGFQSVLVVGNATHEWLPSTEPNLSLRSDVKSHFFSASFVGHIESLPAGSDPFIIKDALNQSYDARTVTTTTVERSYNYIMLLGADLWRLSAAGGPSYVASRIQAPRLEHRAALATSASPTIRLRYLSDRLEARALYFHTRMSGSGSETDTQFECSDDTVRLGATARLGRGIELALDQILSFGRYTDRGYSSPITLRYFQSETAAMAAADFGRYITVRAYGRLLRHDYDVTRPASREGRWESRFGGALEFVF